MGVWLYPGGSPALGNITTRKPRICGLGKEGWASWREGNQELCQLPILPALKCPARAGSGPALGLGVRVPASSHSRILGREGPTW